MSEELKPCPFCGYSASTEQYETAFDRNKVVWEIGCNNFDDCIADAPAIRGFALEKDAIDAWNTRHYIISKDEK